MQPNVTLRTPSLADVPIIHEWAEDSEVSEYFRRFPPLCEWRLPEQTLAGITPAFSICENDVLVGLCQLVNHDSNAKSIEIGLMIDKKRCTNRKLNSASAYNQLSTYLFNHLRYNKLYMKVLTHRDKLVKRLQASGWAIEGLLRQSVYFKGEFQNEILLSVLKEDWKEGE